MHKVIRPGKIQVWKSSGKQWRSFFCKIDYESGKFSISGVIDPWTSGNAGGGCGQIDMEFAHRNPENDDSRYADHLIKPDDIRFALGWNADSWLDFLDIWKRWHLHEDVPQEVIDFLIALPDTDTIPAWI